MQNISPFKGLKDKVIELEVDGTKVKVQPKVEDAELFLTMKQGDTLDEKTASIPTQVLFRMLKRANKGDPEADDENIRTFIALHYGSLMVEIAPLFGFKVDSKVLADKVKKNSQ